MAPWTGHTQGAWLGAGMEGGGVGGVKVWQRAGQRRDRCEASLSQGGVEGGLPGGGLHRAGGLGAGVLEHQTAGDVGT